MVKQLIPGVTVKNISMSVLNVSHVSIRYWDLFFNANL